MNNSLKIHFRNFLYCGGMFFKNDNDLWRQKFNQPSKILDETNTPVRAYQITPLLKFKF